MTRYTLKQLKEMVRSGIAMDLTKASNKEYKELIARGGYTQVGFASGIWQVAQGFKGWQIIRHYCQIISNIYFLILHIKSLAPCGICYGVRIKAMQGTTQYFILCIWWGLPLAVISEYTQIVRRFEYMRTHKKRLGNIQSMWTLKNHWQLKISTLYKHCEALEGDID